MTARTRTIRSTKETARRASTSTPTVREALDFARSQRESSASGVGPHGIMVQVADLERWASLLLDLEWRGYASCAGMGFMGSGPPMHPRGHPACLLCGGLRPEQEHDRCFNEGAKGHRKGCRFRAVVGAEGRRRS